MLAESAKINDETKQIIINKDNEIEELTRENSKLKGDLTSLK